MAFTKHILKREPWITQADIVLLKELAQSLGATYTAVLDPAEIPFAPELRELCDQNACGRFATCWVGPPAVGAVKDLMAQVRDFPVGLVIQTVDQLEDSFDYEGMVAARKSHQKIFREIRKAARQKYPSWSMLSLDAGCCDLCPECTYPDDPCRLPDEAIPSVEAYGINVNPMLTAGGLKYNNGKDTVSYVGLLLLNGR